MLLRIDFIPYQLISCDGCTFAALNEMPLHCPLCGASFDEVVVTFYDGERITGCGEDHCEEGSRLGSLIDSNITLATRTAKS